MVVHFAGVLLRGNESSAQGCVFALAAAPGHHHSKRLTRFHRFSPAHDSAHDNSLDDLREQMRLVSEQHFQELTLVPQGWRTVRSRASMGVSATKCLNEKLGLPI